MQQSELQHPVRIWLDRPDAPVPAPDRLAPLLPPECGYSAFERSPDGRLITADREGSDHIWGFALLTPDGSVQEWCAQDHRYVGNARWSPDGSAIAFSAAEDSEGTISGLYMLERADDTIRRVAGVGYHKIFGWCPDNRLLFVVDDVDGAYVLSLVDRTGTVRRHLCRLNAGDLGGEIDPAWPAWSPDGRLLAVSSIPEGSEHSVLEFYAPDGELQNRVEWPQEAFVRIDDLQWQPLK
jgi:Tol biopolymer transport system component